MLFDEKKLIPDQVKSDVWAILVKYAGAYDDKEGYERFGFLQNWPRSEYRFKGKLGFGGKIWAHHTLHSGWEVWVNCYAEDETSEKREIIQTVNTKLRDLFKAGGLYRGK